MHTMHTYLSLLFFLYFRLLHSTYYCSSATDWQLHPALTTTYLSRGFFEQYIICICMSRCILHLSSFTTYVHLLFPSFEKRERNNLSSFFLPPMYLQSNACIVWRRFANLFETSQSLFWASFGLVSLTDFELTGIKEFTRFWALLMFGSYSVCNIIVLLNMLIAMMSNSFQVRIHRVQVDYCEINCNP